LCSSGRPGSLDERVQGSSPWRPTRNPR